MCVCVCVWMRVVIGGRPNVLSNATTAANTPPPRGGRRKPSRFWPVPKSYEFAEEKDAVVRKRERVQVPSGDDDDGDFCITLLRAM